MIAVNGLNMWLELQARRAAAWRPARHIAYWLGIVLFFGFFWGSDEGYYLHFLISELVMLPPKMAAVYLVIYVLIPRFLWTRNYVWFFATSALTLLVGGVLLRVLAYTVLIPWFSHGNPNDELLNAYRIMQFVADINTVLVLPVGYVLMREWQRKQMESQVLAHQRLEAELQLLKNQIQPHFLFNSLNNLYALVLKKSDDAPDMLLQLSALMRYQLYEAAVERIGLDKEWESLQNYLALERMRYGNRFSLELEQEGRLGGHKIAPLLLLPFVENAFKHGVSMATETARLEIVLYCLAHGKLYFKVSNSKPGQQARATASGIGLVNVRRRLDLLYPKRHSLQITEHETNFTIELEIEL